MFPVWLKFRGGKGVATGVGVFLPICWQAVLGGLIVWVLVVAVLRYVSLGSILAAAAMPVMLYRLYEPQPTPWVVSIGAILISVFIIVKHHENIGRLITGTENRLKFRKN
jgi:glycerol-3-phosphate acyltransferase PlsY